MTGNEFFERESQDLENLFSADFCALKENEHLREITIGEVEEIQDILELVYTSL